jgi:DNA repair exonuclease SbcCD ATPase subunit
MIKILFIAVLVGVGGWIHLAQAQHVIVLKNGRQITVQSYRDEGSMIRFSGLGGEIAISKDQVQSIRRASDADRTESPTLTVDRLPPTIAPEQPAAITKPGDLKPPSTPPSTIEQIAKKRAEEEKAYLEKVKELTEQLRELRDRYSRITRGNTGSEPSFFTTEEAFRGHQEDLLSRLRDAQNKAQGLPIGSAATSPQFSLDPPPPYTEREKALSDLRSQLNQVENDRQKLIEEMKAKNFDTGSLFLD